MTSPADASRSGFPRTVWGWILAWVIIAILAVIWGIPNEQNDLTDRATDLITDAGLDVKFDGRDATILGSADQQTLDTAAKTILNLRGVRRVDVSDATVAAQESQVTTTTAAPVPMTTAAPATTTPPPAVEGPSFAASYSEGELELGGIMPSQDVISEIENAAQETFGAGNVVNTMEVGTVTSPEYLSVFTGVFSVADGLDPWNLAVDDEHTLFAGMAQSAEEVDATTAAFNDYASANSLDKVEIAIEVNPDAVAASLTELLADGANFETGSARLSDDATTRLATVIEIMLANPSTIVTVAGHTDDQGDAATNQSLSEERAQAVVDYLLSGGVGAERLTAVGYGEEQPIADNGTAEGRATNRRIEFVVSEGEQP